MLVVWYGRKHSVGVIFDIIDDHRPLNELKW